MRWLVVFAALMLGSCASTQKTYRLTFPDGSEQTSKAWVCLRDPEAGGDSFFCIDLERFMAKVIELQKRQQPTTEL